MRTCSVLISLPLAEPGKRSQEFGSNVTVEQDDSLDKCFKNRI